MTEVQKQVLKISVGFIYSLVTTYFIIYEFIIANFYQVRLSGGDWGYLVVVLGWPVYIIASAPLLIFFLILSKRPSVASESISKSLYALMLLPTLCGLIVLVFVTFTGRLIYKPIYEQKTLQIQQNVDIKPISIEFNKTTYEAQCNCTRPTVTGSIKISDNLSFPVVLTIKPNYPPSDCMIDTKFSYLLKSGTETKSFHCFFNEFPPNQMLGDIKKIDYTFRLEEENNAGVATERKFSLSDFQTTLNIQ